LKNYVKRTLGKLFTDNYATQCTMTGRGKDVLTKIGDSEVLKTIKSKKIYLTKIWYIGMQLLHFKILFY